MEKKEALRILDYEEAMNKMAAIAGPALALDLIPVLRYFPSKIFKMMDDIRERVEDIFGTEIRKRKVGKAYILPTTTLKRLDLQCAHFP